MKVRGEFSIKNLTASVEEREILHGVSFDVSSGFVHVVMGPNGSGKSTLASVLLGHPGYRVGPKSKILLNGKNIISLPTHDRAKLGLFLAFQSPVAIPGVSVMNLLRSAYEARHKKNNIRGKFRVGDMSIGEFSDIVAEAAKKINLEESLLRRGIHDGFSGGERKKIEMLQALVLPCAFAVFDEIDTGLDVDALRAVASGVELLRKKGAGIIIITHYQRILRYVKPDVVHILMNGRLVDRGDAKLVSRIEKSGYGSYLQK